MMAAKSALVTGVATGIGFDLVQQLAKAGYSLTLVDVDTAGMQRTAAAISPQLAPGCSVMCHTADVRDAAKQSALVTQHVQRFGALNLCVLNAGIGERGDLFAPDNNSWLATLEVDLSAVISGARAAALAMLQQGQGGTIVCVASAGGLYPMQASPVYAAAKAGVVHFTRSAGPGLRRRGVRLLCVCPEFVDTPLVRKVMAEDPATAKKLLGSLDIKLLPPSAVTQLTMRLVSDPAQYAGGSVALLRQDGSVQFPFRRPPPAAAGGQRQPAPVGATVTGPARSALQAWATHNLPSQYKKWEVHTLSTDFAQATRMINTPMPSLTSLPQGTLLVRRVFAGINASDVNFTAGRYHTSRQEAASQLPYGCGFESTNVVVAVGPGVTGIQAGDAVACLTYGGFSEYGLLPASQALPVPSPSAQVVALLTSGLTASIALEECGGACFARGKTVLVTAAAGGTGQFAVQLAVKAGCHVIATAGGPDKVALVQRLGAHRVVDYKREDLKAVLKAEYPRGVDLVFESVGGSMFSTAVDALAQGGHLIIIGMMSQYQEGWPLSSHPGLAEKLLWKSASLHGFFLLRHARLWRTHLARLTAMMQAGQLQVELDPTRWVGMVAVPQAVQHLQSGRSMGKVVVQLCHDLPPGVQPVGQQASSQAASDKPLRSKL